MWSTLSFLVLRRVLGVLGVGPKLDDKDVEIAVLRHQLAILGRQVPRPRYNDGDRLVLSVLARFVPRERWGVFPVTPATPLRWHRQLVRRRWTQPHHRQRAGLGEETVGLVLRLARENPRWGYLRIVGECAKVRGQVSATSVRNILRRHHLGPTPRRQGPTCVEFLRSQASGVLACDFFSVETVGLQRLYVLFFIELERRRVWLAGVTANPDSRWVIQQARNLAMSLDEGGRRFTFLIRDRDSKFVGAFDEGFSPRGPGSSRRRCDRPGPTPMPSGWCRPPAGSVWTGPSSGRHHLQGVLAEFVAHYNEARPHRGIDLDAPVPSPPVNSTVAAIERVDRLGGLIHEYHRAA